MLKGKCGPQAFVHMGMERLLDLVWLAGESSGKYISENCASCTSVWEPPSSAGKFKRKGESKPPGQLLMHWLLRHRNSREGFASIEWDWCRGFFLDAAPKYQICTDCVAELSSPLQAQNPAGCMTPVKTKLLVCWQAYSDVTRSWFCTAITDWLSLVLGWSCFLRGI